VLTGDETVSLSIPILALAALAGGGIFMVYAALVFPARVHLQTPTSTRGLARLQARLDAAELPITAREFATTLLLAAGASTAVAILIGAPALIISGVTVVPAILWQRLEAQRDAFRLAYDTSLSGCVQLMREGFATSGTLRAALDQAGRNGSEPAASDFREVWNAQMTGDDLEDAFAPIVERRRNPHLRMVADALTVKSTQGGTAGEVLLGLETMVREQVTLRREITAGQAQNRTTSLIVSIAPLGFFIALKVLPFLQPIEQGFYSTVPGQIVLTIVIILSALAFFLSRRIASRGLSIEAKEVVA
jgi:Flp pilus assembly protein TadB